MRDAGIWRKSLVSRAAGAASIGLLLTCMFGCASTGPTNPGESQSPMTESTADSERKNFAAAQEQMERILPILQEKVAGAGVDLPLQTLAESSCLGSIVENRQEQTRWEGALRVIVPDPVQAQGALHAVVASLEAEGWTLDEEATETPGDPDFGTVKVYGKDGIMIDASYGFAEPDALEVFARTGCLDHPTDHQMLRSTLDPSYGKSSKYYPDGQ
jgi:hypothetical protein